MITHHETSPDLSGRRAYAGVHRELTKNQKLMLNLISSITVYGINILINLFLSPYIVRTIGVEANGFLTMASDFISYAALITLAINSMAGRFITIAIHREDYESANQYYTGVFLGNAAVLAILLVPVVLSVLFLDKIINIPFSMIFDVKMLFLLIFLNFYLSTGIPSWSTATFATNNLYLQTIGNLLACIVRAGVIVLLFSLLSPKVYYVGAATCAMSVFIALYHYHYKLRLLPMLRIKRQYYRFHIILELITSGAWNTITKVGQILLSGLDLLLANLFLGTTHMGILALSKTLPHIISNLSGTLVYVFSPSLTINYAKRDSKELVQELKQGMKINSLILTVPLSIIIIYGREFFRLWVPSQDAGLLHSLSVLTCFGFIFTAGTQCLINVFTITNRLKIYSLLTVVSGVFSLLFVLISMKATSLGLYAIVGISSLLSILRSMLYIVPYSAKYLGLKWNTFYPEVFSSFISVLTLILTGAIVRGFFPLNTWPLFFLAVIITSFTGLLTNILILLKKEERVLLLSKILRRN